MKRFILTAAILAAVLLAGCRKSETSAPELAEPPREMPISSVPGSSAPESSSASEKTSTDSIPEYPVQNTASYIVTVKGYENGELSVIEFNTFDEHGNATSMTFDSGTLEEKSSLLTYELMRTDVRSSTTQPGSAAERSHENGASSPNTTDKAGYPAKANIVSTAESGLFRPRNTSILRSLDKIVQRVFTNAEFCGIIEARGKKQEIMRLQDICGIFAL